MSDVQTLIKTAEPDPVEIDKIKRTAVAAVFENTSEIGKYGASEGALQIMNNYNLMMEGSSVSKLADLLAKIVQALEAADPQNVKNKPGFFQRLLGKDIETEVRYKVARKQLDQMLQEAENVSKEVKVTVAGIDAILRTHASERALISNHLEAGRQYLAEHPEAGQPDAQSLEFDNARERFERKLANLATLLASHDMSGVQMRMTRAQAVDMLDRFGEATQILVPVWRQNVLINLSGQAVTPEMIRQAEKAHKALTESIQKSVPTKGK